MKVTVVAQSGALTPFAVEFAKYYNCGDVCCLEEETFQQEHTFYHVWADPKFIEDNALLDLIMENLPPNSAVGFMPCSTVREAEFTAAKFKTEAKGEGFYCYSTLVGKSDTFRNKSNIFASAKTGKPPSTFRKAKTAKSIYLLSAHGSATNIFLDACYCSSCPEKFPYRDSQKYIDIRHVNTDILVLDVCQVLRWKGETFANSLVYQILFESNCKCVIASNLSKDSGYPELAFTITLLGTAPDPGTILPLLNTGQSYYFSNARSFYILGNPFVKINVIASQKENRQIKVSLSPTGNLDLALFPNGRQGYGRAKIRYSKERVYHYPSGWLDFTVNKITNIKPFKYLYIWVWHDDKQKEITVFYWFVLIGKTKGRTSLNLKLCHSPEPHFPLIETIEFSNFLKSIKCNIWLHQNNRLKLLVNKYEFFMSKLRLFKYNHRFSIRDQFIMSKLIHQITGVKRETYETVFYLFCNHLNQRRPSVLFDEDAAFPGSMKRSTFCCSTCQRSLISKDFYYLDDPRIKFCRMECPSCGIAEEHIEDKTISTSVIEDTGETITIRITNHDGEAVTVTGTAILDDYPNYRSIGNFQCTVAGWADRSFTIGQAKNPTSILILGIIARGKLSIFRHSLQS